MTSLSDIPNLTPRQKLVLAAVIHHFITRAEPVSSAFINQAGNVDASPATIRNAMAQLEKFGLIEHPHTSAGRQPTDKGYRVYLDSLIKIRNLLPRERNIILRTLKNANDEKEILDIASVILSKVSNLLGIAAAPYVKDAVIKRITLVPIAGRKVMLMLSFEAGLVRNLMVEMETRIKNSKLEKIVGILNEKLSGISVAELNNIVMKEIENTIDLSIKGPVRLFTRSILKLVHAVDYDKIKIAGAGNVVKQPDFGKIEDIEGLIELVDNKKTLVHFLQERGQQQGVQVTVGNENEMGIFKTHSVITSSFALGGVKGTIGVIGPTRMEYDKLISVVDYTSRILSNTWGKLNS